MFLSSLRSTATLFYMALPQPAVKPLQDYAVKLKQFYCRLSSLKNNLHQVLQLPQIELTLSGHTPASLENYQQIYASLTAPHPKLKIVSHKTIGVMLLDCGAYPDFDTYYQSINGKNSAAYYARKANKRAYHFTEIQRNNFIDDLFAINTSAHERQGKKMPDCYLSKKEHYEDEANFRYFGVTDVQGHLRAYCYLGFYGEFCFITNLLGHKNYLNDGIMYLLLVEINRILIAAAKTSALKYVVYDTYFGAGDGLKKFKQKLGFAPYRVKWRWDKQSASIDI